MGLRRNSNWDFTRPVFCRLDLESQSLHHAVERGDVDSLQRLIDTDLKQCINLVDSVNARDGLLKGTPLHAAAEEGDAKVAKFLLLNEADIFAKDRHGNEPLHLASVRGHTKLINLFIEKGAMVNNRNDAGNIALHYACNKGHNEAVDLLLRKGSVLNSKNANGWTPLHLAVVSAHFETVRILGTRGADLDCQDSKGNTPLHLACECNNTGMVEFLLSSGAKTKVENKGGQLPGDLASRPVIKDILGWKPNEKRRSSNSSASTSSETGPGRGGKGDLLGKPKPLENKLVAKVRSSATQPVNSPESFQDRMKRLTREKRMTKKNNKTVLKKESEGSRPGSRASSSWNKRFLKKYGLTSKNLFAPTL